MFLSGFRKYFFQFFYLFLKTIPFKTIEGLGLDCFLFYVILKAKNVGFLQTKVTLRHSFLLLSLEILRD